MNRSLITEENNFCSLFFPRLGVLCCAGFTHSQRAHWNYSIFTPLPTSAQCEYWKKSSATFQPVRRFFLWWRRRWRGWQIRHHEIHVTWLQFDQRQLTVLFSCCERKLVEFSARENSPAHSVKCLANGVSQRFVFSKRGESFLAANFGLMKIIITVHDDGWSPQLKRSWS